MSGTPLTDEEKDRIRELHAQGMSRNAIARDIGRALATITNFCQREGLSFDRTNQEAAARARVVDAKTRRAELADQLLEDAQRLRGQIWSRHRVVQYVGRDGIRAEDVLDEPDTKAKLDLARTMQIMLDRHQKLIEFDSDDGLTDARKAISGLGEALMQLAGETPHEE